MQNKLLFLVLCNIYLFIFIYEGPMHETLDHTIRIGSTPTFLLN